MKKRKKLPYFWPKDLGKRIAALFILAYGAFIIVTVRTTITGAAIGTQTKMVPTFFIGLILFIFGLLLYPRD